MPNVEAGVGGRHCSRLERRTIVTDSQDLPTRPARTTVYRCRASLPRCHRHLSPRTFAPRPDRPAIPGLAIPGGTLDEAAATAEDCLRGSLALDGEPPPYEAPALPPVRPITVAVATRPNRAS